MRAKTERMYRDVHFLTSITPSKNFQNAAPLQKACKYIESEFEKIGAKPEIQSWHAQGNEYKNVSASYNL